PGEQVERLERITDGRLLHYCTEVAVRTTELHSQRTGCRRFRDTAVGGRVVAAVTHHDPPCIPDIQPDYRRDKHHQRTGEPCREPVHQIVEPGGSPSELQEALVFVPDHRIER